MPHLLLWAEQPNAIHWLRGDTTFASGRRGGVDSPSERPVSRENSSASHAALLLAPLHQRSFIFRSLSRHYAAVPDCWSSPGEPARTGDGLVGLDVHCAARLCTAGHGGQVNTQQ